MNGIKKMSKLVTRPWGTYKNILEEEYTKVKKIVINPGESPSYQYHFKRSEVWVIVKGSGEVKINGAIFNIKKGEVINIPVEATHTITNTGDDELVFIEIQLGESFEEEDIVRVEDKYGRA